jgi:hypothetical protein
MTGERAHAYATLMTTLRRLEAVGGLLPVEADQIRAGADALLFCADDGKRAPAPANEALLLVDGLVTVGRWPRRMARRTRDALVACGPPAPRRPLGLADELAA